MANPNLNAPTAVYAANAFVALTTTNPTQLITNAASSGKVLLVDSIFASNVDGAAAADLTITVYNAATNTGTGYRLASTVSVPADSALVPVLKDVGLSVKEGQSVYVTASAANDIEVVAYWKEYQ
jgi:hypothetical protein